MSDWNPSQAFNQVTISPLSLESVGLELARLLAAPVSTTWPSNNQAVFVPFVIYNPFLVLKMATLNGTTANSNIDIGIYDDQKNRLVSMGSTAQAGTSAVQSFDITDTTLEPGVYYMALNFSATTGTIFAWAPAVGLCSAMGVLTQAVGAIALPDPAVFATPASAFVPWFYLTGRTLI